MNLDQLLARAISLLRAHEPNDGYYLAFSGGKDSVVIERLAKMAGVKYEVWHNQTTIDPPELVHFVKTHFPNINVNRPAKNMMVAVATLPKTPPTRAGRWCCELYKEGGGSGRVKIMGVRAAESRKRRIRWRELSFDPMDEKEVICPIVYWSDEQLWAFIRHHKIPYCSLYDEGWERLGCVGCPLASREHQQREFARWPRYEANWKKAIYANWEKYHVLPREDGKPRYHAKFRTAEDFWQWWLTARVPDYLYEDCQSMLLWTNEEGL